MKKSIFTLALSSLIIGLVLMSCQSSVKKKVNAQDKVKNAKKNLEQVQYDNELADQKKAAIVEDWNIFKTETEATINENEIHITQLRLKMRKSGRPIDSLYLKKIDLLEQKNKEIKAGIETYKNDKNSDWESFKRDYKKNMDELGKALKEITDNEKK